MRGDIIPPKRPTDPENVPNRAIDNQRTPAPSLPITNHGNAPSNSGISGAEVPIDVQISDSQQPIQTTKPKKSRRRLLMLIITPVLVLLASVVIAALLWYQQQLGAVDTKSDEKSVIVIEPGSGLSEIAQTLHENTLIKNELAFEIYVRQSGKTSSLQSGSYRLGKSESVPQIVKHLTSGSTDTFSITFLPGATLQKHRQTLIEAGYSSGQVDSALSKSYDHPIFEGKPASADLEGYIYGETYNFPAEATVEQILIRTFDQFEKVVTDNDLIAKYKQQGFTLYQGITMASIIQREVATADDAAQVAQVFKTRYDMGMNLGSDVTYQYIADKTGVARSTDLDSPYNTRRYPGLTPGPISSPGEASLLAVGSPAPGDYIYFLSGDDDKTYFARTNEEHEKNIVEHCQKKCQII